MAGRRAAEARLADETLVMVVSLAEALFLWRDAGRREGLFGERPFAGQTAREIAENVTAGRRRQLPSRSRIPGWLRAIVLRGLSVDPDERHESLKSMLAAIAFTSRIMYE